MALEQPRPEDESQPRLTAVKGYAGGPEMTLLEHLKELRNRVIVSAIALVIATAFCAIFWTQVYDFLIEPARSSHPEWKPTVFGPTEKIFLVFKIALYGGISVASPVIIYEILAFIVPGLTPRERKVVFPALLGSIGFLLLGMAFAYYIVVPVSFGFLYDFGGDRFNIAIGLKQYFDFAIHLVFWSGIAFELPMVMTLLGWLGLVRARQMLRFWRYAIVIVFLIAAVVTPTPDPLTQAVVAGPLLGLYFVGVLFAKLAQRPNRTAEPASTS
jgi:sec-independent protein translocase protein TatC